MPFSKRSEAYISKIGVFSMSAVLLLHEGCNMLANAHTMQQANGP